MSEVRRLAAFVLALAAMLASGPAAAHLTPNSEVVLTVGERAVLADIVVPQGEYAFATGNSVSKDPASLDTARAYLLAHFLVTSTDGEPWTISIERVEFKRPEGPPDLHAVARLIPPRGQDPRVFKVRWSALLDELPSHFALFVLAGDSGERTVLGAVRQGHTTLRVETTSDGASTALADAIRLGIAHILGGYDHLLFLFALLLPAPLIASAGRWTGARSARDTLVQLAKIVTAFTIGHSLTLVGATMGGWRLPTAPVEVAIAVSVLVSAIHAIRPLLPGREHLVALGFGLVHGLAFATLLATADVGRTSTALSLLGFNLGIELVQLGLVVLVVPALLTLRRSPFYTPLRVILATATAAAAVVWIVNRALGMGEGLASDVDRIASHGPWMIAALYALALGSLMLRARERTSASTWLKRKGRPRRTAPSCSVSGPDQRE